MRVRTVFTISSVVGLATPAALATIWPGALWAYVVIVPVVFLGVVDMLQTRQAIRRNFPLVGRGRYWMEILRPKIYQYFIESDTDGAPIPRTERSVVYQRAKHDRSTIPFGTQQNVYDPGYEWMNHSMTPTDPAGVTSHPRARVGGPACTQPYDLSIFNISAMSYGSLSRNAILSLNGGAKTGQFAHNTGEGGISPAHLEPGGDLIWQIGTGYFGCRNEEGGFDPEKFRVNAILDNVKMIEIKLSQGAKPGHGGILPGSKNTPEIADIRGVMAGQTIHSPPQHSAFDGHAEFLDFIDTLRKLSGGKPVGFKLCVGHRTEFLAMCRLMVKTGQGPDFITVDGGEGGTGAAPVEFSDSVGMPLREGLAFVNDALTGFGLRDRITLIASGKILTGFHMFRAMALGADACSTARGMMLALGCIQALECNANTCPTGVATQDPQLSVGLHVTDKTHRVSEYHSETVHALVELVAAAGLTDPRDINRQHIFRRVTHTEALRYDKLFPMIEPGSFLNAKDSIPETFRDLMGLLDAAKA